MTQRNSQKYHGTDIASQRADAVDQFIREVKEQLQDRAPTSTAELAGVATLLERLGQRTELFPREHFQINPANPSQIYRVAEDSDGTYALYVSLGDPGKSQPPHDHTTWAIITGVAGVERNVLYRRAKTYEAARDILHVVKTVDVTSGNSIILGPQDVHTIEVIGTESGVHLHFYGLALDRIPGRVVFESTEGGTYKTFAPPQSIRHALISPQSLKAALEDGEEIAVLDVREAGVFSENHLLYAVPAPLWRLELLLDRLVPRKTTRVVLVDGDETIAHQAAAKLVRLGWLKTSVLAGGTAGWSAAGLETFNGTNVPSKALGELIEVEKHTPWIDVDELQTRVENGENLVVVDSRSTPEFTNFSLPFAVSAPGAELLLRIGDIAPDPQTLVVVNCAGRTRSIVGAQTLIDARIPNRVVSLQNGTMEWLISGRTLSYGRPAPLSEPTNESLEQAQRLAEDLRERAGINFISKETLLEFEADSQRKTLYKFDIRTREEYQSGHLYGWRWAPGGQLVQATDEFLATRHSRIVLVDWDGVRAVTTAAWLRQFGAFEVFLFKPDTRAALYTGSESVKILQSRPPAASLRPTQVDQLLRKPGAILFDVEKRSSYVKNHILGAHFAVPDRLLEFLPEDKEATIIITSSDGVLARVVASELAWLVKRDVRFLTGGTEQWIKDGLPTQTGPTSVLTGEDDQSISPYFFSDLEARNAGFRKYLNWELGLVEQLDRDGSKDFRLIPA